MCTESSSSFTTLTIKQLENYIKRNIKGKKIIFGIKYKICHQSLKFHNSQLEANPQGDLIAHLLGTLLSVFLFEVAYPALNTSGVEFLSVQHTSLNV
jgi:hypothetical protein